MTLFETEQFDVPTTRGPMRTQILKPKLAGRFPALLLYSEIYQATAPILRLAATFAGNGFLVAVPEVYHEFEAAGTVLRYDREGTARGNELKYLKELESYDADSRALIEFLPKLDYCSGSLGALGVCLGGHLALRASLNPEIKAATCFYPTDVHSSTLGLGKCDNTLSRLGEVKGELLMVFGRQDPHVPREGRRLIYERMSDADLNFAWLEFNAEHAFLRDEGPRYDPALARTCTDAALQLFHRALR